jgi:hypothetical protein
MSPLTNDIKYYEREEITIHEVYYSFQAIRTHFNSLHRTEILECPNTFLRTKIICDEYDICETYVSEMYRFIARDAIKTIDVYLALDYKDFLKAVRVFDPRKIVKLSDNFQLYLTQFQELKLHNKLLDQFKLYYESDVEIGNRSLEKYWIEIRETFPELAELALTLLRIPSSQAAVERSFSMYRKILDDSRHNLLNVNLKMMKIVYYNNRKTHNEKD